MKVLYFDTETTGLDHKTNGLIQLSGLVEIDGEIKESFDFKIAPFSTDVIVPEALRVNNTKPEDLLTYPKPEIVYGQLLKIFNKYIDKYDKKDKFFPAGYNIKFDIEFLHSFFEKNKDLYFGSYCNWHGLDALALVHYMEHSGAIKLDSYKLGAVCAHFNIALDAHDANRDILATRELMIKIKEWMPVKRPQIELPF